jgi:simple sugar transport system permease protein
MKFPITFVRTNTPPAWWTAIVSLLALLLAALLTGLIFWLYGLNPWNAAETLITGTLGDFRGWSEVFRRSVPLIFTGTALCLALRTQFWNIGAEGQLLAGAVAAGGVALFVHLPAWLLLPAMFLAGTLAGALWIALPAFLRLKMNVNEIISSLMLNYMAINLTDWLVRGPWKGAHVSGFAYSDTFPEAAWLPVIDGTRLPWPTLALGLALCGALAWVIGYTTFGFEVRVTGQNPEAARYAGIHVIRASYGVILASGAVAGLAGAGEVAGIHHKLLDPNQIALGYGYTGLVVALLARERLALVPVAALLLGGVFSSGDVMKVALRLPFGMVGVINGLLLLCLVGTQPLTRLVPRRHG